ncbi:MAG: penicillin-binding protein 2 [Candidatus Portnoybacteria bacterium]|nr:penicillin-binding protein 2 [Candidatus Portnoybacteria bacterium]MDD4983048.1 penicillin-binding protein 2 [Candidatus Portnoybacteria bacterium]
MLKFGNLRLYTLLILLVLVAGGIAVRLFSLQIIRHSFYAALAEDQHDVLEKLTPRRGGIFIQEKGGVWHPLAVNRSFRTVFLVPKEVADKNKVAEKLAPLVGVAREKILEKLKDPKDPYEPLKSKLDDEIAEKIKGLNLKGVRLTPEEWRWYPQGTLASNVLGFVGIKDNEKIGQYGIEQYYQEALAGKSGLLESQKDALGNWLLMGDYNLEPAEDGANIYLTLDQNIQYAAEQRMKALMAKWNAGAACAVVMEPKTGAIRAMVSLPDFDPNEYQKTKSADFFMNSCVQKLYEPGSVFKPIVMAAGLDTGKISPETAYTDAGILQIGSYTIQNAQQKTYGPSTMTNVLEKSINTGVVFVQRLIGGEIFKKYIEAFGFDELTGIDLSGETRGDLKNIRENREINFATAAFGQGISVTPIEMASSIAAIANGGKLMRPYVVEKIVHPDGREEITQPKIIRQAVAPQTAGKLTAMLVSTVRNGYDKVKLPGYFVAGKTGTAQIASSGGYSADETNHSFEGYAPAYDPKFLIFLRLEKPRGIQFASESLAPVFSDLARYLFNYYEIPPEE